VLGGGWGWMHVKDGEAQQLAEASARRDEVTRKVTGILENAQLLRGQGDYGAALVALAQAETVLSATSDAEPELAPRVAGLRGDVERAAAADAAELAAHQRTDLLLGALEDVLFSTTTGGERLRLSQKDADFTTVFADYGLDILGAEGEAQERAVVEALRATDHGADLAVALDEWARAKLWLEGFGTRNFELLIRLAMDVDPDPWRLRLRRAILTDDRRALEALAESRDAYDWPPATVVMFHRTLDILGHGVDTLPLMRATQVRHPGDHPLNRELGITLNDWAEWEPSPEAFGYLQAARAVRPADDWVSVLIIRQLILLDRLDEALELLRSQLQLTANLQWWFDWVQPRLTDALKVTG